MACESQRLTTSDQDGRHHDTWWRLCKHDLEPHHDAIVTIPGGVMLGAILQPVLGPTRKLLCSKRKYKDLRYISSIHHQFTHESCALPMAGVSKYRPRSYPGEGSQMSVYGSRQQTSDEKWAEKQEFWRRENVIRKNHLSVKGDGTEMWQGSNLTQEQLENPPNYYSDTPGSKASNTLRTYDRIFNSEYKYDPKRSRDDHDHQHHIDIGSEEESRPLPLRSSGEYGLGAMMGLDKARQHGHCQGVQKTFYTPRSCGVLGPPDQTANHFFQV